MARKAKYLTDAETFNKEYERLVQLRKELSDRLAEVNGLITELKDSSDLPVQVKEHLGELEAEAANLSALLTTTQTYADSIETYYTTWSATKDKIDAEYKEAQSQNEKLTKYIDETQALKDKLKAESDRSTALLNDARKTLDIVTNTGLSSVFIKRSEDRRKARRWWTVFVALAVVLFAVSVLFAVTQVATLVTGQGEITVWVLRLAVVTPFAFVLYFVTRQYTHERDYNERYTDLHVPNFLMIRKT